MEKSFLVCSFSGGKTSAYMAAMLKQNYSERFDISYVFANTGQENEATLEFVQAVDEHFKLSVVWVEAVVHSENGIGTTHRITNFKDATRNTDLFAAVCAKFGIPNASAPHCTRELKQRPIDSYMRSNGLGPKNCKTAIGIRIDESRRVSGFDHIVYPLVDWFPTDRQDIDAYWEDMPFTLNLKSYEGNCSWCWKKSDSKLFRLATEKPYLFLAPESLELTYGKCGPKFLRDPNAPSEVFFRSRRSAQTIVLQAAEWAKNGGMQKPVRERSDSYESACSESCEFLLTSEPFN